MRERAQAVGVTLAIVGEPDGGPFSQNSLDLNKYNN